MSFPRYESYKDSGVEWLGDLPEHWKIMQFKRLASIQNGRDYKYIETENDGYPVIGSGGEFTRASEYLFSGESVLLGRKGTIDKPLYINGAFWVVDTMFYTVVNKRALPKYLYYCALTIRFDLYSTSTAIPSMTQNDLGSIQFAIPYINEQQTIANFLDLETAKIDELIAEQQRLIELLKEKRQAVISHAVTKGLNPDVPMKDSGIDWLGEVPEHWRFGAIKHFVLQKSGSIKTGPFGSHLTSADMQAVDFKVYNQRNVIDNDFLYGENFISKEKFRQLSSFEAFPGDLLITTRGTIGRAAILPENAERGILHPCLLRIQPDNKLLNTKFLKALIQDSHLLKTQISYMSNATTIEVIYSETIASVIIPVPPVPEQECILKFLQDESAKIDKLNTEAKLTIELLKERRTALISAAVTGKIDVRGFSQNVQL